MKIGVDGRIIYLSSTWENLHLVVGMANSALPTTSLQYVLLLVYLSGLFHGVTFQVISVTTWKACSY